MMITRDNYEIWFLDYLEGKLDAENMEMVREFLRGNPDLAGADDGYIPELTANKFPVYPHKERLKKAWYDDHLILEQTAISAMEGDLMQEEQDQFGMVLTNKPDARKLVKILLSTKIQPDLKISFPGKGRLKRKTILIVPWIRIVAVAAILTLAFFIFPPSGEKAETSYFVTPEAAIPLKGSDPVSSPMTAGKSSQLSAGVADKSKVATGSATAVNKPKPPVREPLLAETRTFVPIEKLQPKSGAVTSGLPVYADLILIKRSAPIYYASGEIPLSVFYNHKLQALNASQTKDMFTREEFKIAGLRLFSRIPGNHLTGKKGKDGRLKSISFNSQMLAFSIPVNQ